jgi:hypothetical protein
MEQLGLKKHQCRWDVYDGNVIGNYTVIKVERRKLKGGGPRKIMVGDRVFDSITECARFIYATDKRLKMDYLSSKLGTCARDGKLLDGLEVKYVENTELPD